MDGAPTAIRILQKQAQERAVELDARVADLEKGEFRMPAVWDLTVIYRYLHRDLFEPAKLGVRPGGVLLAVVLPAKSRVTNGSGRASLLDISRAGKFCTTPSITPSPK